MMRDHQKVKIVFEQLGACHQAKTWVQEQPTKQAAWDSCRDPTWMFWLLLRVVPHKKKSWSWLTLCLASFVRKFATSSDMTPQIEEVICMLEQWAQGDKTVTEDVGLCFRGRFSDYLYSYGGGQRSNQVAGGVYYLLDLPFWDDGSGFFTIGGAEDIPWALNDYSGWENGTIGLRMCDFIRTFYPQVPELKDNT
jgi:hypothetical protein